MTFVFSGFLDPSHMNCQIIKIAAFIVWFNVWFIEYKLRSTVNDNSLDNSSYSHTHYNVLRDNCRHCAYETYIIYGSYLIYSWAGRDACAKLNVILLHADVGHPHGAACNLIPPKQRCRENAFECIRGNIRASELMQLCDDARMWAKRSAKLFQNLQRALWQPVDGRRRTLLFFRIFANRMVALAGMLDSSVNAATLV